MARMFPSRGKQYRRAVRVLALSRRIPLDRALACDAPLHKNFYPHSNEQDATDHACLATECRAKPAADIYAWKT